MKLLKWALIALAVVGTNLTYAADLQVQADPDRALVESEELLNNPHFAKELACLTKNIYYEAGSEPFEGKVAVANITVNRMNDERYPKTICGVVQQKTKIDQKFVCQFSWVCEKRLSMSTLSEKYLEALRVAKLVLLEGYYIPRLDNSFNFHAIHVNPGWGKKRVAKIGNHVFYADKKKPEQLPVLLSGPTVQSF